MFQRLVMDSLSFIDCFNFTLFIFTVSSCVVVAGSAPGAASSVFRGNKPNQQGSSQRQDISNNNQPGGIILENYDKSNN